MRTALCTKTQIYLYASSTKLAYTELVVQENVYDSLTIKILLTIVNNNVINFNKIHNPICQKKNYVKELKSRNFVLEI